MKRGSTLIVNLRQQLKHLLWKRGWDLRRVTPMNGIDVMLWNLLPQQRVNCVIDVGAHVGEYGMLLRALGYTGRIASFEPTHAAFTQLSLRARSDPNWRVYPAALGTSSSVAEINVTSASNFSSFRNSSSFGQSLFEAELTTTAIEHVQVRRLDDVFADVVAGVSNPRVYLKLDTQGWDLEVLAGAAGCLDRVVAAQSEMSVRPIYEGMPSQHDAIAAFGTAGFDVVGMFGLWPSPDGLLTEFDCVMVRHPAAQAPVQPGPVRATA